MLAYHLWQQMKQPKKSASRIFIGLTEIAGFYTNLVYGFAALGVEATFVDIVGHPFQYQPDQTEFWLIKRLQQINAYDKDAVSLPAKLGWLILRQLLKSGLFVWAILNFDLFIFCVGNSFWPYNLDLPILKLFGKRVIVTFHGSDARPAYISGAMIHPLTTTNPKPLVNYVRKQKQKIKMIERFADVCVNHPLSAQLHQKPFVFSLYLGLPFNYNQAKSKPVKNSNDTIRILHSPSHPKGKGTDKIRQTIENLKAKGHKIDWVEIINMPNQVVLAELQRCDFVVDQLYSDTPMAGFATEAAYFGKPAVVGGYCWPELRQILADDHFPPSAICHPDNLEATLERLITDQNYRCALGQQAQTFVNQHWQPVAVAKRYLHLIEDTIPDEWLYDPKEIRYCHGWGIAEENLAQVLRQIIKAYGLAALQISDKPELERRFQCLAELESTPE